MSAELEELGFSATAGADAGESNGDPQNLPCGKSDPAANSNNSMQQNQTTKRSAAEISEDEESSASSKARRVTRPPPASTPTMTSSTSRFIAPKPNGTSRSNNNNNNNKTTIIQKGGSSSTEQHGGRQVNTSTAHVKALTGSKGAAMCFEIVAGTHQDTTVPIPNLASTELSAEEKSKFSRDRNRLHARNTRIRKKAYVDELKRTLDVLVEERDSDMAAKHRKVQVELEERDVRFSVMEEFLRLRGSNEQTPGRWNAILEEDVTMRLPNLDWNGSAPPSPPSAGDSGVSSKKTVSGVRELMKESNAFAQQWLQSARTKKSPKKATPAGSMVFHCDRKSLLMEGANVVMDWTATSTDPAKKVRCLEALFQYAWLFCNNTRSPTFCRCRSFIGLFHAGNVPSKV